MNTNYLDYIRIYRITHKKVEEKILYFKDIKITRIPKNFPSKKGILFI